MSTRQQPIDLWAALNERQRRYLTAIHEGDQAAESRQKGGAFNWGAHRPAPEWRWPVYGINAPKEPVGRIYHPPCPYEVPCPATGSGSPSPRRHT